MTTKTVEYVTTLDHEPDCYRQNDRSALFLRREIAKSQDAYFASDEDGEYINADGKWTFEENLAPLMLRCEGCWASRYVALDEDINVIALTSENCPRANRAWGHTTSWDKKPCKYCGHERKNR
jgi:hypothetical protein